MIRHILKVIRNERKANTWIFLEFIVVFCILWFCCDYLYYLSTRHLENPGFDIKHTYLISMSKQPGIEVSEEAEVEFVTTFTERVKHYPGVEYLSFSNATAPYQRSLSSATYFVNEDSLECNAAIGKVTPEFFDVFKIPIVAGSNFDASDMNAGNRIIISPGREGNWKSNNNTSYPLTDIRKVANSHNKANHSVIGYTPRFKKTTYQTYFSPRIFFPLQTKEIKLHYYDITVRIHPSAGKGFEERFMQEMKTQLELGPYYLSSVESMEKQRLTTNKSEVGENLNSVLAITAFLIVNIFLGIIGTFWARVQSRRSEIGLRIALGASKRKVKQMLLTETFLLLFISSIIGTLICLNLGQTELLQSLGIPLADREQLDFGAGQDFINYGITFAFLLIVSWMAVWYPATQASNMQPAESLRSE